MPGFFDETTYTGRFKKFLELTSPRHLFHSNETIQQCKAQQDEGTQVSYDTAAITAACVHPTTQQVIPFYGRMAMFVPMNIPICSGMLMTAPTLPNLIGWQWINQTYNAVFNYSNSARPETMKNLSLEHPIMKGYLGSATVSVSLAVGLTQCVKRGRLPSSIKPFLQKCVPYIATSSAGVANVLLMRSSELKTGIPVMSKEGTYIGHSKIAAKSALMETAVSRAVLPIPMLLLPPPVTALASRLPCIAASQFRKKVIELSVLLGAIALGLPAAIALYPQHTELPIHDVEPELSAVEHAGETVFFNKGV